MEEEQGVQIPAELKLECLHTTVGFDLLADPGDYLSILLLREGIFEAPETDLVTRIVRPGDTCIDAGCQLGYYTCLLARQVTPRGRVFSFDANPRACQSTERNLALNGLKGAEVMQAALADRTGTALFYISTDDQTGLSSLGPIATCKETIPVPCLRLDEFLSRKKVERVRLLKLDVEGAEEAVLRGLGHALSDHLVDFILVECYEERLQLLNASATSVAKLLENAAYIAWEYGTEKISGWSRAPQVRSRGDCNYLFVSPSVRDPLPAASLAGALSLAQAQRNQFRKEVIALQQQLESQQNESAALRQTLESEVIALQQQLESQQNESAVLRQTLESREKELDWVLECINTTEQEVKSLREEKAEWETRWKAVENSAGWRMLNAWRRVRDLLAPTSTQRRKPTTRYKEFP